MEIENIHLVALLLTALVILYADHQGFRYFRGEVLRMSESFLVWSHRLIWVGLIALILSGIFLVLPSWEYYMSEPIFYLKMGFVLTLIVNAVFIGKLTHFTTDRAFSELPDELKKTFLVSGALSVIGWVGSAVIGFFFL